MGLAWWESSLPTNVSPENVSYVCRLSKGQERMTGKVAALPQPCLWNDWRQAVHCHHPFSWVAGTKDS